MESLSARLGREAMHRIVPAIVEDRMADQSASGSTEGFFLCGFPCGYLLDQSGR
jgi:hypothetical protein